MRDLDNCFGREANIMKATQTRGLLCPRTSIIVDIMLNLSNI